MDCDSIELHELPAYLFAGDVDRLFWLRVCVPFGPALLYSGAMVLVYRVTSVIGRSISAGCREAEEDAAAAAAAVAFAPTSEDGDYEPVTPGYAPSTPTADDCVSERARLHAIKTAAQRDNKSD